MLDALDIRPTTTEARLNVLEDQVTRLRADAPTNTLCLVVHGGDFESLCAAFVMANSAAALGSEVKLFFTFWATAALRDPAKSAPKSWFERLMGWMFPKGAAAIPLSRMNMAGLGPKMMRWRMKQRNVENLGEMLATAREMGVRISVCEMSMDLLGMRMDELVDYPNIQVCGASTFLVESMSARLTLFV